jgi:hypothetical protein
MPSSSSSSAYTKYSTQTIHIPHTLQCWSPRQQHCRTLSYHVFTHHLLNGLFHCRAKMHSRVNRHSRASHDTHHAQCSIPAATVNAPANKTGTSQPPLAPVFLASTALTTSWFPHRHNPCCHADPSCKSNPTTARPPPALHAGELRASLSPACYASSWERHAMRLIPLQQAHLSNDILVVLLWCHWW